MFQFTAFALCCQSDGSSNHRVAPFGNLWISPCQRVPTALRRLPRPSSPPEALGIPQTPFAACLTTTRFSLLSSSTAPRRTRLLPRNRTTLARSQISPYRSKNKLPSLSCDSEGKVPEQTSAQLTITRQGTKPPPTGSTKEVFQPHLPVRLPCYDLALVTRFTLARL